MRDALLTPRPVPNRILPTLAGALVLAFALPVFLLAGWPLTGWALAVVLWLGVHALDLVLTRQQERLGYFEGRGALKQ